MIPSTPHAPSHSRLRTFHHCSREYYYKYILGIEPKRGEVSPMLHLGSALHAGLERWYATGEFSTVEDAITESWDGQVFHGDLEYMTLGHALWLAESYVNHWSTKEYFKPVRVKHSDLNQNALFNTDAEEDEDGYLKLSESSFVVDIGDGLRINVILDLVVEWEGRGKYYVVDHKTSKNSISGLQARLKREHQLRMYYLAMNALLPDLNWAGAIGNAIHTVKPYTAKKKGGEASRFARYMFSYDAGVLEETLDWIAFGREEMLQADMSMKYGALHIAPQNAGRHCDWCDYGPLCETGGAQRKLVQMNSYRSKS